MYLCLYVCNTVYIWMYLSMCVCTYVYIYVCIFLYIPMHLRFYLCTYLCVFQCQALFRLSLSFYISVCLAISRYTPMSSTMCKYLYGCMAVQRAI